MKLTIQLHQNTFIQLLAPGVATPDSLDAFLSFHTKRGARQNKKDDSDSRTAGTFERIVKFIKGA
jgi:hypothetical protein